jgi:hypothetical protein
MSHQYRDTAIAEKPCTNAYARLSRGTLDKLAQGSLRECRMPLDMELPAIGRFP